MKVDLKSNEEVNIKISVKISEEVNKETKMKSHQAIGSIKNNLKTFLFERNEA
jgi:hypothetical protein